MATQTTLPNDLLTLKNIARSLFQSCRKERSGFFFYITPELEHLYEAASESRIAVSRREFKNLKDVNQTTAELDNLRQLSVSDLQALQDLLIIYVRRRSSRIRVDEQDFRRKLENFRVRFDDQCRAFYRIVDVVNGREDWARLSPKEPSPKVTPPAKKESGKTTPESSTSNKITISAPPSPYQATVEEVEDVPSDEPSMVESYHYVHPMETPPTAPEAPIQTPPVVLVRAPTDGLEEEASQPAKPKESSGSKYPQDAKSNDLKDRATRPREWSEWRVEDDDETNDPRKPSKIVTQTQHDERPLEDIQEEIIRLQAELDHMKLYGVTKEQPPQPSDGKRRTHNPSMDLGVTDDSPLDPYPSSRHRAMTTPSAEAPAAHEADKEFRKPRRTPKPSPRERPYDYTEPLSSHKVRDSPRQSHLRPNHSPKTPQSAVEMGSSPWLSDLPIDEGYASNQKTDGYGVDPRHSLPMVNQSGSSTFQQGPGYANPSKRTHRYSENYGTRPVDAERAFNDFLNSSEGLRPDFDLFGPGPFDDQPGASGRPGESSTRNSSGSRGPEDGKPAPVEKELPVTLEEIYDGAVKKFKIRRTVMDPGTGRPKEEVKSLDVPIYRGLKPRSKIKFQGEGGVSPLGYKQDLHFILVEKAHPVFTRRDRDLHTVVEIGLGESLLGWQRTITSICGKTVKVSHEGPTPPNWQEPFAGLGMCSSKNVEERGDLIVGVKIKYPGVLSERQKALIRAALMEK